MHVYPQVYPFLALFDIRSWISTMPYDTCLTQGHAMFTWSEIHTAKRLKTRLLEVGRRLSVCISTFSIRRTPFDGPLFKLGYVLEVECIRIQNLTDRIWNRSPVLHVTVLHVYCWIRRVWAWLCFGSRMHSSDAKRPLRSLSLVGLIGPLVGLSL